MPRFVPGFILIRRSAVLWLVCIILLSSCSRQDIEQQRICERLIPWFERTTKPVEQLRAEFPDQPPHTVVLHYQNTDGQHWLRCQFGGGGFSRQRLVLAAVESDREGELAPWQLAMLRGLWLDYFEPQLHSSRHTITDSSWRNWLYLLQQILNTLPLGCIRVVAMVKDSCNNLIIN